MFVARRGGEDIECVGIFNALIFKKALVLIRVTEFGDVKYAPKGKYLKFGSSLSAAQHCKKT